MSAPAETPTLKGFHLHVPTVSSPPTYASLQATRNALGAIAAQTPTTRGGGANGYMGIVLPAPIYDLVAPGTPFTLPQNPGQTPALAGNTAALIAQAERRHKESLRQWYEYNSLHEALKDKLAESVDPIYLQGIRMRRNIFAQVSLREMFLHLFNNYSQLDGMQIHKNRQRLYEPWDPSSRIEDLIGHLEDVQELATDAGRPIPDTDVVDASYSSIYTCGLYDDECKTWEARPDADRTWSNFKRHFLEAQTVLTRRRSRSTRKSGYTANAATGEMEDLVGRLVATNESYINTSRQDYAAFAANTQQRSADAQQRSVDDFSRLFRELQDLKTEVTSLRAAQPSPSRAGRRSQPDSRRRTVSQNDSYCWTHGFEVAPTHNSGNCRTTLPGHRTDATKDNMLGGSTLGQRN
jgi:hypothetical protein